MLKAQSFMSQHNFCIFLDPNTFSLKKCLQNWKKKIKYKNVLFHMI